MGAFLEKIDELKELLDQELEGLKDGDEKRVELVAAFYDLCLVQERILPGYSGLKIQREG